MSEWAEREAAPPRVAEWLHVATGVVLFVAEREEGYGAHIRAPEGASIDTVSIGDPDTGEFERFDDREAAVAYTDDWKETEAVLKALEPGDEKTDGVPGGGTEADDTDDDAEHAPADDAVGETSASDEHDEADGATGDGATDESPGRGTEPGDGG